MRRGLIALLTTVSLAGVGAAQAAITTNLVEDFSTFDRTELSSSTTPANNTEILGGLAENRWMVAATVITTNATGKLEIKSSKHKPRAAFYTITADQFGGADPNAQLAFDVVDIANEGTLEVAIFSIQNPGTSGNAVKYDALGGGGQTFVTDGTGVGLEAVGIASVSMLVSTSYGGLVDNTPDEGLQTISFEYNGTDDIVLGFSSIGLNTTDSSGNKKAKIDDIVVTTDDSATYPASLNLDASDMPFFSDASASVTGTITVSYTEGLPAANVNVSQVSIENDSTGNGFSVSPTSIMLNDPVPSNKLVEVVYDNSIGGLPQNGAGTADVQFIWNEVGSMVMNTSSVPVSVEFVDRINENEVLALFDQNFTTADQAIFGLDTAVISGLDAITGYGSTDTSYGTKYGDAPTEGGAQPASNSDSMVVIAVTNNTGFAATLNSFHFDVGRRWANGPGQIDIEISGGIDSTNIANITGFDIADQISDEYLNVDIPLSGLGDHVLLDGEYVHFTFTASEGNASKPNAVLAIDNVALLGSGTPALIPASVGRVSQFPWESLGVSGLDLNVSQAIDMIYSVGDLNTNISIEGVSFASEDDPGAWSAVGAFPVLLPTPDVTNSAVFDLVFDNTVANVPAGTNSYTEVIVEISEPGYGTHTFSFSAWATRPATVTNGVIALFHTEFMTPDAAHEGVMGSWSGGEALTFINGSIDGDYGTLTPPAAPTNDDTSWRMSLTNNVSAMTLENRGVAEIELSDLHFDIGRWYLGATNFTVAITGDVSPTNIVKELGTLGFQNEDYEDHDIPLAGLADRTLGAGESLTLTFTLAENAGASQFNGHWIDNVAFVGTADNYGGWAASKGLNEGVNDDPSDNPDGDSKDNLMEYATGGDPLVADGSAAATWQAEEGGTDWMYHVHNERLDDDSLTYGVGTKENLQFDPSWDGADAEEVGATSGPGLWKSVTNRTEMSADAKFIGLEVEQN